MRWSLDEYGALAHTDRAWKNFTGLTDDETLGQTTRLSAHPDDQPTIASIIKSAVDMKSSFLIIFRLRKGGNNYAWVTAGASPSFAPIDGSFIGFLGTTDVLRANQIPYKAIDVMRRGDIPKHQIPMLDMIAEHVTAARNVAKSVDDRSVQEILDYALLTIGDLLFQKLR